MDELMKVVADLGDYWATVSFVLSDIAVVLIALRFVAKIKNEGGHAR
jgi:hypothetical protein